MREIVLVLDNLRSVENVGSLFRTADGLGVAKLILVGTTPGPLDRFGRKRKDLAKVALGAEESVKWESHASATSAISYLKEGSFTIVALEQTSSSVDLKNFQPPEKIALVVGNEVDGVSQDFLNEAIRTLEIGMKGRKESLNVAVATGIALFHLSK